MVTTGVFCNCVSADKSKSMPKPISSIHPPPPVYRVH